MNDFKHPIGYLESSDFSDSGDLIGPLSSKPLLVMIQGSFCGACTKSKPDFQKLADEGSIACMTIQLDGARQTEKDFQTTGIINSIYPKLETVPSYILFVNNSKRIPYTGGDTSFKALKQFVQQNI
jgi:thiol-disulfide isomerase/thioredoxin